MLGKIIKSDCGFYTVYKENGETVVLKPRGLMRHKNLKPKVGDNCLVDENSIIDIVDRKNTFIRPVISNVDYVLLITSLKKPDLSLELLDKFILNITEQDVEPIIIFTKCDLCSKEELDNLKETFEYYEKYFKVFYSSRNGIENRDKLYSILKEKISIVSGQTGAGKSFLLNLISPELALRTQEISDALGRGKHTTRVTELYRIDEMFIADSPGFSSLDFVDIDSNLLKNYYPEFVTELNKCKFDNCSHISEPGCRIKDLVNDKLIIKTRYENYVKFYKELKDKAPIYKK